VLVEAAGLKTHPHPDRRVSVKDFGKGQDITHGKDILPLPARCPLMRAELCVDEATRYGDLEIS
jgi:hypothetical protein